MDVYKAILSCCVSSHVLFETFPPTECTSLHAVSYILVQSPADSELRSFLFARFPYQSHWHRSTSFCITCKQNCQCNLPFGQQGQGRNYVLPEREESTSASQKDALLLSQLNPSFEGCSVALLQNKTALVLLCVIAWFWGFFSFCYNSVDVSSCRRKWGPNET